VAADAGRVIGPGPAVHAVWNAVDLSRFSPRGPAADLDALAGLPPAPAGVVRVGLVATFARWKGHATFLDALARLPESPLRAATSSAGRSRDGQLRASLDEPAPRRRRGLAPRALPIRGRSGAGDACAGCRRPRQHGSRAVWSVIAEGMACASCGGERAGGAAEITTPGVDALAYAPVTPFSSASACSLVRTRRCDSARRRGRATAERVFIVAGWLST
jgi:hypothetical protein